MKDDRLKADFTAWLETLAYRTKIDFIRKESKYASIVLFIGYDDKQIGYYEEENLDFECEWLRDAFSRLSHRKQKIIKMIFLDKKTPVEIADELGCTRQHIYNQCSLAYKQIRAYKRDILG